MLSEGDLGRNCLDGLEMGGTTFGFIFYKASDLPAALGLGFEWLRWSFERLSLEYWRVCLELVGVGLEFGCGLLAFEGLESD